MKKMQRTIATVLSIMLCLSLPAYAAEGFDLSLFQNQESIEFEYDEMEGISFISTESVYVYPSSIDGHVVNIGATIIHSDRLKAQFYLGFITSGYSWPDITKVCIKIDDTRYDFPVYTDTKLTHERGLVTEAANIIMGTYSAEFIQDLIAHQSEENIIKVRLYGNNSFVDFNLPQTAKDRIVHLYNLYAAAGGTQRSNIEMTDMIIEANKLEIETTTIATHP